jgi:hypothetical protein
MFSSAAEAADLLYTYRPVEVAPLKGYEGQPYWRVLAECAGIHGALANSYQRSARQSDFQAAKARGVHFLQTANQQVRRDRGVTEAEARALTTEAVDAGRAAGAAFLSMRPASSYSHEQLIDLLCTQVSERHARALRSR